MRKYEEVEKLMFYAASVIKLRTESAEDLVQDAWLAGRLHKCHDHQLFRTITNDMIIARRKRIGTAGSLKYYRETHKASLDTTRHDVPVEDKSLLDMENKEMCEKLLELLDVTGQEIIKRRMCNEASFREIGKDIGICKTTTCEKYHQAIGKMRESKLIQDLM